MKHGTRIRINGKADADLIGLWPSLKGATGEMIVIGDTGLASIKLDPECVPSGWSRLLDGTAHLHRESIERLHRCKQCENCKFVEDSKVFFMPISYGPNARHATDTDVRQWNEILVENPCTGDET